MPERAKARRGFVLVVALVVLFCLGLKLITVHRPHVENDEIIYWQLAQNLVETGRYSLQGTEFLEVLPPAIYDRPLFHHPPLYPALLVPFVLIDSMRAAVAISWLGHILSILAVALIGRRFLAAFGETLSPYSPVFWVPLLGMAFDPVTTFVSQKLWIDALLEGLLALSLAVFYVSSVSKHSRGLLITGGILLGLAALTKVHALLAAPVAGCILVHCYRPWHQRWRALFWGGLPVLLLIVPWFAVFYRQFGTLLPWWIQPDAQAIRQFPFIKWVVERPATFYAYKLMLIEPLVPLVFAACLLRFLRHRRFEWGMPLLWFLLFFVTLTYMGKAGMGFQLRHLCPLLPCAYVMVYSLTGLTTKPRSVLLMVSALCIMLAAMNVGLVLISPPGQAGLLSIFEAMGLLNPV